MQDDGSPSARAVVRVGPDRAACYWQAISGVLERIGVQTANLEISVLEPSKKPAEGAPHVVELELRCVDLEQSVLDEAVRYAASVCEAQARSATSSDSGVQAAADEPQRTRWHPVAGRPGATVSAPLLPRAVATIHAPLFAKAQVPTREPVIEAEPSAPRPVELPSEAPVERPASRSAFKAHASELFKIVATLVVVVIGVRLLIQTFSVDGPSMNPTFETDQRLLINRAAYWHVDGTPFEGLIPSSRQGSVAYVFGGPHRGDVVVFRPPGDSGFQSDLIKRIIGLPGDTVSIQDGQVSVNGQALAEPYVKFPADYTYPDRGLAVLIPNDSYFVLGDNRPVSVDSHFGWVVPADKLVGQAWLLYWPITEWRLIPGGQLQI